MRRYRDLLAIKQKYDGSFLLRVVPVERWLMGSWYQLAHGNDDDACEPTLRLQQMLMSKFLMCVPGSALALLSCHDKDSGNPSAYFSAVAQDVALRVCVRRCDPPMALDCAGLLAREGDALRGASSEGLAFAETPLQGA